MPFCLTSLNIIISRSVHVVANGIISFFLWLSGILLFIYTTSLLSVYGHLNCFHVLALVNSAAVNIGYMHLLGLWFSPGICPGIGLPDDMVVLVLVF